MILNHTQTAPMKESLYIDLPNIFSSQLYLNSCIDHISSLKEYGNFADKSKQYDNSDSQDDTTQPKDVTCLSKWN